MFENTKREYENLTEARREHGRIAKGIEDLENDCRKKQKGWNEYGIACKEKGKQQTKIKFYKNNYLYVLMQESKPVLQKVFDKYIGKRIGEKTKQKIQEELKEYGLNVYWHCEGSSSMKFSVSYSKDNFSSYELYLFEGMYDENGKLKQLNFDDMYCCKIKEYVENIEERIEKLEKLEEEIKQKEKELNELIESHYDLCVSGLETYSTNYVKTTIK